MSHGEGGPQTLIRVADGAAARPGGTDHSGPQGRGHGAGGTQRGWRPGKALLGGEQG